MVTWSRMGVRRAADVLPAAAVHVAAVGPVSRSSQADESDEGPVAPPAVGAQRAPVATNACRGQLGHDGLRQGLSVRECRTGEGAPGALREFLTTAWERTVPPSLMARLQRADSACRATSPNVAAPTAPMLAPSPRAGCQRDDRLRRAQRGALRRLQHGVVRAGGGRRRSGWPECLPGHLRCPRIGVDDGP